MSAGQNSHQFVNQALHHHRRWVRTAYGAHYTYNRNEQTFVLMSYNILADFLLRTHPNLYKHNQEQFLHWPYRLNCLKHEIIGKRPTILCLQEVQQNHLNDIEKALRPLNYAKPLYKKRNGNQEDGCAIFYNPHAFELVEHHYVEYFQPNVKLLDRYNVAIIAKFASKRFPKSQLIVATTHLLYNPRRDDIRTAQVQVLLSELDRLSHHNTTNEPLPIILTGDFNCQHSSDPFRLITDGEINTPTSLPIELGIMDNCKHLNVAVHQNRKETMLFNSAHPVSEADTSNKCDKEKAVYTKDDVEKFHLPFDTKKISHQLNLTPTLYANHMASTYHDRWITVDFIFYTKFKRRTDGQAPPQYSVLQLLGNYELPSIRKCVAMGPIPNQWFGSDHYLLAAEFVLLRR